MHQQILLQIQMVRTLAPFKLQFFSLSIPDTKLTYQSTPTKDLKQFKDITTQIANLIAELRAAYRNIENATNLIMLPLNLKSSQPLLASFNDSTTMLAISKDGCLLKATNEPDQWNLLKLIFTMTFRYSFYLVSYQPLMKNNHWK
ncbi:hypothetical protein ACTFIU_005322 [Dictyostelium citrinum]